MSVADRVKSRRRSTSPAASPPSSSNTSSRLTYSAAAAVGPLGYAEWATFIWFVLDAFTHLSIELGYVILALGPTAERSSSLMGYIWREYSRADKRWGGRDPNVISLELLTVFVVGPLCLWAAYGIYYRKPYRHVLQLSISVAELYGGFMTFVPDILDGCPNLAIDNPVFLWIYLLFMNGVWVWIPVILIWESSVHLTHACVVAKTETHGRRDASIPGLPPLSIFHIISGTCFLYVTLLPLVLLVLADPPKAKVP